MMRYAVRWSTEEDFEKILFCVGMGFSYEPGKPNKRLQEAATRLMSGQHPSAGPHDFCVVEDLSLKEKPVVACACLQNHIWSYEGIDFPIGRPEAVATLPEYRNQGLMRMVFEELHKESERRGHFLQAIVGIPYFYHNVGYTYGLRLHEQVIVPLAKEKKQTSLQCRKATVSDIPFVEETFFVRMDEYPIFASFSHDQWNYYLENPVRQIVMIEDEMHERKGFFLTSAFRAWKRIDVYALELQKKSDWISLDIVPTIENYLQEIPGNGIFEEIGYALGPNHPVYLHLPPGEHLENEAWYIRLTQTKEFLKKIRFSLDMRMRRSPYFCDFTGKMRINFYKGGLFFTFLNGSITAIEDWKMSDFQNDSDFEMPEKDFWKLIMGYRSVSELLKENPDVMGYSPAKELLETLFPQKHSFVLPFEFK